MLRQRARSAAIHLLLKCVNFSQCIVNTPSPPGQMIGVVTKSPKALASLEMIDAQEYRPLGRSDGETGQKNHFINQPTEHQRLKHIYKL